MGGVGVSIAPLARLMRTEVIVGACPLWAGLSTRRFDIECYWVYLQAVRI